MVQIRLYAEIYELVSNTLRCTLMTQFKKVFFLGLLTKRLPH